MIKFLIKAIIWAAVILLAALIISGWAGAAIGILLTYMTAPFLDDDQKFRLH